MPPSRVIVLVSFILNIRRVGGEVMPLSRVIVLVSFILNIRRVGGRGR